MSNTYSVSPAVAVQSAAAPCPSHCLHHCWRPYEKPQKRFSFHLPVSCQCLPWPDLTKLAATDGYGNVAVGSQQRGQEQCVEGRGAERGAQYFSSAQDGPHPLFTFSAEAFGPIWDIPIPLFH